MSNLAKPTQRAINAIAGLDRGEQVAILRVLASLCGCTVRDHGSTRAESAKGRTRGSPAPKERQSNDKATAIERQFSDTETPSSPLTLPPSPLEQQTAIPPVSPPKRGRKARPRGRLPDGLANHVLAEMQRACRDLTGNPSAGPRCITPGLLDILGKLQAAEDPDAETWSRVIDAKLADSRLNPEYAKFLTLEHLCAPSNFRRYRDQPVAAPNGKADLRDVYQAELARARGQA